jgi:uncharacterized cofD-like protein
VSPAELVVVTGMTGAGRSTAAKELEDLGFYVVDNLPPSLVKDVVHLIEESRGPQQPIAVVVDVRSGSFFSSLTEHLRPGTMGRKPTLVFLEATDEVLVRRQEAARRPHPLQGDGRLLDGLQMERVVLAPLRADADLVIDTSALNVHQLTDRIATEFGTPDTVRLRVSVVSFGFKYGIPVDTDYLADMRFLPNPHWVPELRAQTGRAQPVSEYVLGQDGAEEFLSTYTDLLVGVAAGYLREGKRFAQVAIGCTGGKHRSVAMAEELVRRLTDRGVDAARDLAQSVVAFGGGHGLHASLSALRLLVDDLVVDDLTAVVTVADNGGSSGRLRKEFGVLPPGDLRMALAALCGTDEWGRTWSQVVQHRFAGQGEMNGHNLGNLLIVGLWELLGDHVDALDYVGRLLGSTGRVLPMALTPMDITAEVRGLVAGDPEALTTVRGQVEVATTDGLIDSIALVPEDPPATPAALAAIAAADWCVLGPGSWFTSVIPHLLVPDLRQALVQTDARVLVVLNLVDEAGETPGFGPADHLAVLLEHAPDLRIDTVLVDASGAAEDLADLEHAVSATGAKLAVHDVAVEPGSPHHDPPRLAAAYAAIMGA